MEPIAVVHWLDSRGRENIKRCCTQEDLNEFTRFIRRMNYVSWTMICNGRAYKPPDEQRWGVNRFKIV